MRPSADRRPRFGRAAPWVLLGLVGALVRSHDLNRFSFWLDEILETYALRCSWGRMWRGLKNDLYNPPLDYVLRKPLEALNPADFVRRIPSVGFGTVCVVVFGLLIARRAGRAAGLAASALLALAPYHVRYSQEVRPYALGLLLVCLSLLSLDFLLERMTAKRAFLLYLCVLATAYTMYLCGLVLGLAAAGLLLDDLRSEAAIRRANAKRFLKLAPGFVLLLLLGYLPWLGVLLRTIRAPALSEPPEFHWSRVTRVAAFFGPSARDWSALGLSGWLFMVLVLAGIALAFKPGGQVFLVTWGIGGLLCTEILEHRHSTYDSVFHYLPSGIALTGLCALTVGTLLSRRATRGLGGLLLAGGPRRARPADVLRTRQARLAPAGELSPLDAGSGRHPLRQSVHAALCCVLCRRTQLVLSGGIEQSTHRQCFGPTSTGLLDRRVGAQRLARDHQGSASARADETAAPTRFPNRRRRRRGRRYSSDLAMSR